MESVIQLLKIRCSKSTGFFYQCNLITEKDFVLRYDKATIKKELANMKIKLNPDQEIVNMKRNMAFRLMEGETGPNRGGLY